MTQERGTPAYRGEAIKPCSQYDVGQCNGRGWHVIDYHESSGLQWSEQLLGRYNTLAEAKAAIDQEIAYREVLS